MNPQDSEEFRRFLDEISKGIPSANAFLLDRGTQLPSETSEGISGPSDSREVTDSVDAVEENVNRLLDVYQKKLFGDEPLSQFSKEDVKLENLARSAEELFKNEKTSAVPHLKDCTSLLHKYNVPDPHLGTGSERVLSSYPDALLYLERALKRNDIEQPEAEAEKLVSTSSDVGDENKIKECSVGELACILAAEDEELRKLNDSEEIKDDPISSSNCEKGTPTGSKPKKKKKKKKKENDSERKKIAIDWSDPRHNPEFSRELEDLMNCNTFEFFPKHSEIPPELDDLAEDFAPPCLPRDIVSMITSAPENNFDDWVYSLKLEKGECSDCEEFEVEDFTKEFNKFGKEVEAKEEKNIEASGESKLKGHLNVSEFIKPIWTPVIEEIIGVRDDSGNIVSYESLLRRDEHLSREYERVFLGQESETEDEDKEVNKGEEAEIAWEKEHVKGSGLQSQMGADKTVEELQDNLNDIKVHFSSIGEVNVKPFDPELEEQMKKVDKILNDMGIPKAGEIKIGNPKEIMEEEVKKIEHIFTAHQNKICPPGTLEVLLTSEDEHDEFIKNLNSFSKECDNETILRPALQSLISKIEKDSDEDGSVEARESVTLQSSVDPLLILFGEDNEDLEKPLHEKSLFEDTDSAEDEGVGEICDIKSTEHEENILDQLFKEEYIKRGGTEDGLGESEDNEEDDLELKSLKKFTEKNFTFPFMNKLPGKYKFVRARRIIAQSFPKLRKEAFADLSKASLELRSLDDSSSESSQSGENFVFKTEPFEYEEIESLPTDKCTSSAVDESWLTADENDDSEFEPMPAINWTLEQLQEEDKYVSKKKRRKKRERKVRSDDTSDSEEENATGSHKINAVWSPINKCGKPSCEASVSAIEELHPLFKPPPRFKTPKGVKKWLKGEYTPSKEKIREWKNIYSEHYGDITVLEKVICSDKQTAYELFLDRLDDIPRKEEEQETNLLLIFKRILEEKKSEKERKEKAEEIISSSDFGQLDQVSEIKEENKSDTSGSRGTSEEKGAELVTGVTKLSLNDKHEKPLLTVETQPETIQESDAKPPKTPVIRLRDIRALPRKEEWAEEVNCDVKNELGFPLAMEYSFDLDGFQREAIRALESGFNVFVSAHTSAGKTAVAEYAIAMSNRNRSKAVYTSPVKALSNQKYNDFQRVFGSVGLITGDTQLNENAECLIMTTEILRSMLYNSSEKIRDLEFVVFDEVHYINDPERGHVWEEVLILLPSQVQIVMLSATVPNTLEFANWVGRTKQRKVMVCATHHRPVPLNHYLYTGTGGPSPGETYLIKSSDGTFNVKQYMKSLEVMKGLQESERQNKRKQERKRMEEEREWKKKGFSGKPPVPPGEDLHSILYKKDQTMWIALISFLEKKDWLPAVSFVFSRKKCDTFAEMLYNVDLTTKSEKSFIHKFIKSQIEKLDEVDQNLPQIQIMKRQLDKGIGVHHSGILPRMKEIVEVLFQEGKVKLLFATETFAMGVNMPARTVIFHAVKKFDGNETRLLQPAEYVQMAGRAGRRGKDAAGNVIILTKPKDIIARHDLETLLYGNPCKLISKFRLSYRMILNTLTVSGMLTVQNMMERSFCENHGQMKRKFLEKDLVEAENKEKSLKKSMNNNVEEVVVDVLAKFYDHAINFIEEWFNLRVTMISLSRVFKNNFTPGRLLKISTGSLLQRTALLIESEEFLKEPSRNTYKVMVMDQNNDFERVIAPDGHDMSHEELEMWYRMVSLMDGLPNEQEILNGPNDYSIHTVKCHNIVGIYKETLKLPKNLLEEFLTFQKKKSLQFSRNKTCDAGDSIARYLYGYTGKYTAIDESEISFDNFELDCRAIGMWTTLEELRKLPVLASSPLLMKAFRRVFRWKQALRQVKLLRKDLSAENMTLYPDFRSKMELLKEKGYISSDEQVQMKGYMAARIGKYELIVCEMLVENVLLDLSPEEVAALLSFLVYQTNTEDTPVDKSLPPGLEIAIQKCKKIMDEVTALEKKYDIRDFEGSEISKLKFGLVPMTYAWAKQEPLVNIMGMVSDFGIQEGLIVRWIQQLLETLKEVEAAARLMGDPGVPARLQAAGQLIKRGIVFVPSLYTTMV